MCVVRRAPAQALARLHTLARPTWSTTQRNSDARGLRRISLRVSICWAS